MLLFDRVLIFVLVCFDLLWFLFWEQIEPLAQSVNDATLACGLHRLRKFRTSIRCAELLGVRVHDS